MAVCAGLIFVYSRFSPESSSWFPKCIFLQLTGLKCPGCGSQRVVHNLLNLNIHKAFEANAFLVLSLRTSSPCWCPFHSDPVSHDSTTP
ncbi:MAG: DUF2752 domain-containing protein [Anaerovoracaceae bacterium]